MITLTPAQQHAKEVIEWLMSDGWSNRGVGRSLLMCIIFIERAMNNPKQWIPIWDHGPHHPKKEDFMLEHISKIIEQHYPEWNMRINRSNKCFCMEKK